LLRLADPVTATVTERVTTSMVSGNRKRGQSGDSMMGHTSTNGDPKPLTPKHTNEIERQTRRTAYVSVISNRFALATDSLPRRTHRWNGLHSCRQSRLSGHGSHGQPAVYFGGDQGAPAQSCQPGAKWIISVSNGVLLRCPAPKGAVCHSVLIVYSPLGCCPDFLAELWDCFAVVSRDGQHGTRNSKAGTEP